MHWTKSVLPDGGRSLFMIWHGICKEPSITKQNTTMKKIFLSILMLAAVASTTMADSYHDLFSRYTSKSIASFNESLGGIADSIRAISRLASDSASESAVAATTMILDYAQQQFVQDIFNEMEPYYRKHLSEAELQALIDWESEHPRLEELRRSGLIMNEETQKMINSISNDMPHVMKGEKVAAVKINKEVPKSYCKAFDDYISNAFQKKYTDALLNAFKQQLSQLGINIDQQLDPMLKQLNGYMKNNLRPLLINSMYASGYQESDLQLLADYNQLPVVQKEKDAAIDMMGNLMDIGMGIVNRFISWLEPRDSALANRLQMAMMLLMMKLQAPAEGL